MGDSRKFLVLMGGLNTCGILDVIGVLIWDFVEGQLR